MTMRKSNDPSWPFWPVMPCGPVGPCGPCCPAAPGEPTGPRAHVQNFACAPFPAIVQLSCSTSSSLSTAPPPSPAGPGNPLGPGGPTGPEGPAGPGEPPAKLYNLMAVLRARNLSSRESTFLCSLVTAGLGRKAALASPTPDESVPVTLVQEVVS